MAWVMQILAWAVKQYSHVLLFAFVKASSHFGELLPITNFIISICGLCYSPFHCHSMQSLESQRHEYQRSLNVMRDTAEMHISELEQQLKSTSRQLEQEKLQARNLKEEHRKRVEGLQVENAQIRAELEQV